MLKIYGKFITNNKEKFMLGRFLHNRKCLIKLYFWNILLYMNLFYELFIYSMYYSNFSDCANVIGVHVVDQILVSHFIVKAKSLSK